MRDTWARRALAAGMAMAVAGAPTISSAQASQTGAIEAARKAARGEALRVIDGWLAGVRDFEDIPALTAGVVVGDDLVWAKGYGTLDAEGRVPATPGSVFSICSISKLFTAVAVMRESEAGRLSIDQPITTYLPWATLKPAQGDSGPITLRGVLSHSAGLPRESDYPYWIGPTYPFPTQAEMRAKLPDQAALYPPGRWFQYSNLGITLAGEAVEAKSGQTYDAYVRAAILGPLGLKDTQPSFPVARLGRDMAVGWGARKRDGTRDLLKTFDTAGIAPAAGFTSTVEDLGKFASWQFRLARTEKPEILKASTLHEMQRVQFVDADWRTHWGLGFQVGRAANRTYVGHGGSCPGYETLLRLHMDSQTAVVVMQNAPERPGDLGSGMFGLIQKRESFAFKAPAPAKDVALEDYAGRYDSQPFAAELLVSPWAGGLAVLRLPSRSPADELQILKAKGGDVFRRVRLDGSEAEEVVFQRDRAGKVTGMLTFSNVRPKLVDARTPGRP
ncbi:MAG: serine hydrolase domain-containing protein [Phenylobacterium sp.]|nr:serine hydrolase domain-containing protein [Phenylobacterium sp.]